MDDRSINTFKYKKQPFIIFEGLSGSGKTTIAKLLATTVSGIYISASPKFITYIREVLGRDRNLDKRFSYYLLGNAHCSEVARKIRIFRPVICDRYIHSTIAMHTLLGVSTRFEIASSGLLQPDISFFLLASDEQERRKRVDLRNKKNKYDAMQENDKFRRKYIEYFRSIGSFVFIETAGVSIDDTLAEVKKHLVGKFPTLVLEGSTPNS